MAVVLRPATARDFDGLIDDPLPYRVRAFAADNGDELLGVGGLVFLPTTVAAFLLLKPGANRFKIALHKAGLATLAEARRLGIRKVTALAEQGNPAAEPWLVRLGFRPVQVGDAVAWVWQDGN